MLILVKPEYPIYINMITLLLMIMSPFSACYMGLTMSPILLNSAIFSYFSCIMYLIIGEIIYFLILYSIDKNEYK